MVICLLTFPRRVETAPVVFMCEVVVVELWMQTLLELSTLEERKHHMVKFHNIQS